jgi:hypothetical protein
MRFISYEDKQRGWMYIDDRNRNDAWYLAICLLEELLTRGNRALKTDRYTKGW